MVPQDHPRPTFVEFLLVFTASYPQEKPSYACGAEGQELHSHIAKMVVVEIDLSSQQWTPMLMNGYQVLSILVNKHD